MQRQLIFRQRLPGGVWLLFALIATLSMTNASIAQDSEFPMISLETVRENQPATVSIDFDVTKKTYSLKVNGQSFSSTQWIEIEKRAMQLFPGQTIKFARADGTVLRIIGRTMIGLVVEPVTGALASQVNVGEREALVVLETHPELPAAKAGLRQHDVILEVNGQRPMSMEAFSDIMNNAVPKDVLGVVIMRHGRETEAEVRLLPYDPESFKPDSPVMNPSDHGSPDLQRVLDQIKNPETGQVLVEADPSGKQAINMPQMSSTTVPNGPNYAQLQAELAGLRDRLRRIEAVLETILMLQTKQQDRSEAINR